MWYVPKRELIGALVTALENERLQIASSLRYAAALVGELQAFRLQVTGAGRAAYGAETGAHDDLVVAVALAVWCTSPTTTVAAIIPTSHSATSPNAPSMTK